MSGTIDQGAVAIATLAFFMLVQFGLAIWWASGISQRMKALEEKAKDHGSTRDEVIRLQEQIKTLIQAVERLANPPNQRPSRQQRQSEA